MNATIRHSIFHKFLIFLLLFAAASPLVAQPQLAELHPRGYLPNFFAKLHRGDSVRIVYFGGSITEAGNGWREQSAGWIQEQFPKAKVKQINASIGGTGSDLGVFRLKKDVLPRNPDLVFVEFAVNNHGFETDRTLKSMEGIVRQIWKANPTTDICFVYTLTATSAAPLAEEKLTTAMSAMEQVAEHYKIPSVQMGLEIVRLHKEGKLIFSGVQSEHPDKVVFSKDNVHPYSETGHRLYAEALGRALDQMKKVKSRSKHKHKLGKPLLADNWENAQMIPVTDLPREGKWEVLSSESDPVARSFQNRLPVLIKSDTEGSSFSLSFKGRMAGIYDIVGPGCGQYEITIDNGEPKEYRRFDRFATYYRTHYLLLPELEEGEHTIRWTVSGKKLDKAGILNQEISKPEEIAKFAPHYVYAGYLLLIGNVK